MKTTVKLNYLQVDTIAGALLSHSEKLGKLIQKAGSEEESKQLQRFRDQTLDLAKLMIDRMGDFNPNLEETGEACSRSYF